jgi:imidazolonepropionase-like amidohydrolase
VKIFVSGGVGSPADPIHFPQYSREELRAAVEEAAHAGTYVMAHAYTAAVIYRAVEAGIRTIEHGNFLDRRAADLMAENAHTYVLAHAYTAEAVYRAVDAGIRSIEHGNFLDRRAADLMAKRGA